MYGLTEAFRSTYLDPDLVDRHPTSIGRAIPCRDHGRADSGAEAAPDEEGELVHAGPLVAQGYWQDTAHRRTLSPRAGVLRAGGMAVWSGDRVRRDAEGLLHFVGRRDAMIKTSGNRVSPQEVEEAAVATGLVAEAVALGLPDPHLGHAIHLVARPAVAPEKAEAELLPALTRAPQFHGAAPVHWRADMPVSPNGKLDRVALAAELAGGDNA
jgi:acyl-coenzyme A synthetase/AMP-(fatty) acid ligase